MKMNFYEVWGGMTMAKGFGVSPITNTIYYGT